MPLEFKVHRNPDLNHLRYRGHVTRADSRSLFSQVMAHPDVYPGMPSLVDFTELTEMDPDLPEMLTVRDLLAERYRNVPRPILIAILAYSDTAYGIGRMFQTVAGEIPGVEIEIFDTLGEALAFHGIDDPEFAEQLAIRPPP